MDARKLLKLNIDALLKARNQNQHDLAQWCRRSDAWLSKILSDKPSPQTRSLPLKYLDRMADFFGIAPYQLFQPGISPLTERRKGGDRRSGRDRRKSAIDHRVRETVSSAIASLTPEDVADLLRLRAMTGETRADARSAIEALTRSGLRTGGRARVPRRAESDGGWATRPPIRGGRQRRAKPPETPNDE